MAYHQNEMYPFFRDSFNKHRVSTISDQIYVPPPISLVAPVSWARGPLFTESSGFHWSFRDHSCNYSSWATPGTTHFSQSPPLSAELWHYFRYDTGNGSHMDLDPRLDLTRSVLPHCNADEHRASHPVSLVTVQGRQDERLGS